MADASGPSGNGETAETRIAELSLEERRILTALAIAGEASLSEEELAAVADAGDVASIVANLQRRGVVHRDEQDRYSLLGRIGAELRETDQALATGERLAGYVTALAHAGDLSPGRLAQEAEAILGLSEWMAEHEQWNELLELVQTAQSCFSIARRIDQWIALLHHGRSAAQALGDRDAEVQILQQLATAHSVAGDAETAQRCLREADEVERSGGPPPQTQARGRDPTRLARTAAAETGRRSPRTAYWVAGLLAAAGAGLATGWAVADSNQGNVGSTTIPVTVTVTLSGQTFTTTEKTTLPAETITTTTTVTTAPPPPPVP
jgi:hypothetical protein